MFEDVQLNLVPENINRIHRRKAFEQDPSHNTLKDKREKRDEMKEKKFKAQIAKQATGEIKSDENKGDDHDTV